MTREDVSKAASLLGRKGAGARRIETKACAYPGCTNPVVGIKRKRYCSDAHRNRAAYERRKKEG